MSRLDVINLTKSYDQTRNAVANLSFSLQSGEIATLLGPSGCGKTTTLRLIAGFERPDSGRIIINSTTVADETTCLPPEKRGIGMVFQDYALFPHMTVAENIAFPLKKLKVPNIPERVHNMLALVGLAGFQERFPHQLSGGQQQRVALARALSPSPGLILLDEPFSNLDAGLRVQMRQEIRRIIKMTGTTAIFVSHDQGDALALSDRIIVMRDGILQQDGAPREVYECPANRFVAEFVGKANIVTGTVAVPDCLVKTFLGPVPCRDTKGLPPGRTIYLAIRPDSFELDPHGSICGKLISASYTGTAIEGTIQACAENGSEQTLKVRIPPQQDVTEGMDLRFRVRPDFICALAEAAPA